MKIRGANRLDHLNEYYFSKKLQEIDALKKSGQEVLNLGIGNPDLDPPENALSVLSENIYRKNSHKYQSYRGTESFRAAISEWYQFHYGVKLNPNNEILPLIGSKEGIFYISLAFLNPDDEVLIPDPGYPTYSSATRLAGGKAVYYSLEEKNGWKPDFSEIEQRDLSKTKLMWLNYPHMPTGARPESDLFQKLVSFARKHNILICNDNPYSFILNDKPLSILGTEGASEVALELNSLSKSHNMPGWRLGMLLGHEYLINTVLKVSSNIHSGMFLPIQEAAIEALRMPSSWYDKQNEVYKERRMYIWKLLDLLNCRYTNNQSGLFVWAEIPIIETDSKSFSDQVLKKYHLFITPGFVFGNQGNRYIRISLCSDVDTIKQAISRIEKSN